MGYQFDVLEVLQGELTIGDSLWTSPAPSSWSYSNTTSQIWVFGDNGSSCFEHYPEGRTLFATVYQDSNFGDIDMPFGYTTSPCIIDNLTLSDEDIAFDRIDDANQRSTYSLEELKELITMGCKEKEIVVESDLDVARSPAFVIFPNPTPGLVYVGSVVYNFDDLDVKVYNTSGQSVHFEQNVVNRTVDLSGLDNGLYFISIEVDNQKFVKRIIKAGG